MLTSGAARAEDSCDGKIFPKHQNLGGPPKDAPNSQPDLKIDKPCTISAAGTYMYANVHILGPNGSLEFIEPKTQGSTVNFWAKNIIVESGGTLKAGEATAPYGSQGGVLNIYLYGPNQSKGLDPAVDANKGQGVLCETKMTASVGPCGIPTGKETPDLSIVPGATTARPRSRSRGTPIATISTSMAPCTGTRGARTRPTRAIRPSWSGIA